METDASGYGLIEGPVWDKLHGLYFSDVLNGGVFRLDRAGKVMPVVPERRLIGGMALHDQGGLVVGGFEIDWISLKDGTTKTLLKADATPSGMVSTTSRPTRWAASMSARSPGGCSATIRPSPVICT